MNLQSVQKLGNGLDQRGVEVRVPTGETALSVAKSVKIVSEQPPPPPTERPIMSPGRILVEYEAARSQN
jgi:hypothetical protein